MWQDKQDV